MNCIGKMVVQPGRSSLPSAHSSPMPRCSPVRLWPGRKTGGVIGITMYRSNLDQNRMTYFTLPLTSLT